MLKQFFGLFLGCLFTVLIVGAIIINMITNKTVVEFWVLLLIPTFLIPILTAVIFSKDDNPVSP